MIDLVLAVCCSLGIGMIFKHAAGEGLDRLALLTVNYAAAAAVAVVSLRLGLQPVEGSGLTAAPGVLALGGATGVLFIAGFFVFALATQVAGMGLAVAVQRLAVVIPFLASWAIWSEIPSTAQRLGLLLGGAAFFLIAFRPDPSRETVADGPAAAGVRLPVTPELRTFGVLALLFIVAGTVDVSMKTFDELFAATNSRAFFLLLVFGVALVVGTGFVAHDGLRYGRWPTRAEMGWGIGLGIINYGSVLFFLRAIEALSGPFVFPANHIALVIGAALLGVYFWDERLRPLNWAGLGLAAVAFVLLNL